MKTSNSKLLFAQLFTRKLHRGEKTKLRMIESGIEVLATKGLDHFTFEEVGRRVKMNRAQVKYHYKDKHELLRHCFEYVVIEGQSRVVQELEGIDNWREQLDILFSAFLRWVVEKPKQAIVLYLLYHIGSYDPQLSKLNVDMNVMGDARVRAILGKGKKEKQWTDSHIETMAHCAWALVDGLCLYYLSAPKPVTFNRLRKLAMTGIKSLLGESPHE